MLLPILFFLLIGEVVSKSCIDSNRPKVIKCLETFQKVAEAAGDYDLTNATTTKSTNEVCGKFKRCSPAFACETEQKIVYALNMTLLFCDAAGFFTNEFLPCQIKLDSKTTECSRAWNPFPAQIEDKKKMAEIQKEACNNYFGKDNCMREEIIRVCGAKQWNGFRKHHLALNTIIGACHFKDE
ncbi:hypothetical protein GCK72_006958 [Caenorhabditis remanei]|uniref:T20D4.11-like domain-containing protein n=1 Tax=Caenorhabditis remanei TaxID=31234 RepID=A0A6A5HG84_CAERE|nr:hypothetical protein GCK72_006958 [Caenorhabditis remanei]KAF1767000.1 hypothetical protein GCK72_006958 [Caenorhabditis remanei]